MKAKKIVALISVLVILASGLYAVIYANGNIPKTYDGRDTNVVDLVKEPSLYGTRNPDGIADIIVKENIQKTRAQNNVAAVVFDFRGYDTLGESFILLTAIAGSFVILARSKKKKKEDEE